MKAGAFILALAWAGLWFTPDQQGQRMYEKGEFTGAAKSFRDPMWRGVALFRAAEFEEAAQVFAGISGAEAEYNQGNAWLMNGKYDVAIACYDRALAVRPDWKDASENRELAAARKELTKSEGDDMGDQRVGADDVVFDKKKDNKGQDTQLDGGEASSDDLMQALWLRRVQTRPAEFLKAKFNYQKAMEGGE